MSHLKGATVAQLKDWLDDILNEILRRAGQPVRQEPAPPWAVSELQHEVRQTAPVQYRAPQHEPKPRPAFAAGEDGHGHSPQGLASMPLVHREPAKRPPGTVYPTGATDPELAKAFAAIPARQGQAIIQGSGHGTGEVSLEGGSEE